MKKPNIHVHVKTNRKNTTCTDRDTKKKVDYLLTNQLTKAQYSCENVVYIGIFCPF